jgi:hypothetical protein
MYFEKKNTKFSTRRYDFFVLVARPVSGLEKSSHIKKTTKKIYIYIFFNSLFFPLLANFRCRLKETHVCEARLSAQD